jgi:hypothetical protein
VGGTTPLATRAAAAAAVSLFLETTMADREKPMGETEARQLAWDYRQKFKNSEAFEAAWEALFELKTSITSSLARRFLSEEFVKYRAHLAGLEEPPPVTALVQSRGPETYVCPGCERELPAWGKFEHAKDCVHYGCYEMEIRFREGKRRQAAARQLASEPSEPAVS